MTPNVPAGERRCPCSSRSGVDCRQCAIRIVESSRRQIDTRGCQTGPLMSEEFACRRSENRAEGVRCAQRRPPVAAHVPGHARARKIQPLIVHPRRPGGKSASPHREARAVRSRTRGFARRSGSCPSSTRGAELPEYPISCPKKGSHRRPTFTVRRFVTRHASVAKRPSSVVRDPCRLPRLAPSRALYPAENPPQAGHLAVELELAAAPRAVPDVGVPVGERSAERDLMVATHGVRSLVT